MSRKRRNDEVVTPLSDALVVRMLRACEQELAALECMPKRRRRSPTRSLEQMQSVLSLIKRFGRLMDRWQTIKNRPPSEWGPGGARAELKRRIDARLAEEREKAEKRAAETET